MWRLVLGLVMLAPACARRAPAVVPPQVPPKSSMADRDLPLPWPTLVTRLDHAIGQASPRVVLARASIASFDGDGGDGVPMDSAASAGVVERTRTMVRVAAQVDGLVLAVWLTNDVLVRAVVAPSWRPLGAETSPGPGEAGARLGLTAYLGTGASPPLPPWLGVELIGDVSLRGEIATAEADVVMPARDTRDLHDGWKQLGATTVSVPFDVVVRRAPRDNAPVLAVARIDLLAADLGPATDAPAYHRVVLWPRDARVLQVVRVDDGEIAVAGPAEWAQIQGFVRASDLRPGFAIKSWSAAYPLGWTTGAWRPQRPARVANAVRLAANSCLYAAANAAPVGYAARTTSGSITPIADGWAWFAPTHAPGLRVAVRWPLVAASAARRCDDPGT